MDTVRTVIILLLQSITLCLFIISSVYVFLFGKKGTGIKSDYVLTAIILLLILWRLS